MRELLERSPWRPSSLVGSLGDDSRARLLELGSRREYHSGEALLREEEPASFVVVLLDGFVKVTRAAFVGNPVLLAIRGAGDIVGQESLAENRLWHNTVTAAGHVAGRAILRSPTGAR